MHCNQPTITIVRNSWKPGNVIGAISGDSIPKTAFSISFVCRQHETLVYGLLKSVFQLKTNTLNGTKIDYEVWVSHIFDNNRQRPSLDDAYRLASAAVLKFQATLADSKAAHRVTAEIPPFPYTEHEIRRELIAALNLGFRPNGY